MVGVLTVKVVVPIFEALSVTDTVLAPPGMVAGMVTVAVKSSPPPAGV
jgi:hypothetical protein